MAAGQGGRLQLEEAADNGPFQLNAPCGRMTIQQATWAAVQAADFASLAADGPFVIEILQAMVLEASGGQGLPRQKIGRRQVQLPGRQGLILADHQIIVGRAVSAVDEDDKGAGHR